MFVYLLQSSMVDRCMRTDSSRCDLRSQVIGLGSQLEESFLTHLSTIWFSLSIIQSVEIQLLGSHYNCSSNSNFIIYHTFNFVTEWLHNKDVMPYYRESKHILHLPSLGTMPNLNVIQSNCVY